MNNANQLQQGGQISLSQQSPSVMIQDLNTQPFQLQQPPAGQAATSLPGGQNAVPAQQQLNQLFGGNLNSGTQPAGNRLAIPAAQQLQAANLVAQMNRAILASRCMKDYMMWKQCLKTDANTCFHRSPSFSD
jgi:hypothetical protein